MLSLLAVLCEIADYEAAQRAAAVYAALKDRTPQKTYS